MMIASGIGLPEPLFGPNLAGMHILKYGITDVDRNDDTRPERQKSKMQAKYSSFRASISYLWVTPTLKGNITARAAEALYVATYRINYGQFPVEQFNRPGYGTFNKYYGTDYVDFFKQLLRK